MLRLISVAGVNPTLRSNFQILASATVRIGDGSITR
jgi:hypothetical protein